MKVGTRFEISGVRENFWRASPNAFLKGVIKRFLTRGRALGAFMAREWQVERNA